MECPIKGKFLHFAVIFFNVTQTICYLTQIKHNYEVALFFFGFNVTQTICYLTRINYN